MRKASHKQRRDPYVTYDLNDWHWEFLRRNNRYRRLYHAVQRAKDRNWGYEVDGEYVCVADSWVTQIRERLSLCSPPPVDDPNSYEDYNSLPSPEVPSYSLEYCPIKRSPAVVVSAPLKENPTELERIFAQHPDLFGVDSGIPKEHLIVIEVDNRSKIESTLSAIRKQLQEHRKKSRDQIRLYKEYLQVWDLRQQGQTADEIAPSLWPDENATKGGRTHYGERGALIQRVYDYEKAANELVKNSFRSKRRAPKIKK
jgi:hypothetical protein